jgi:hypothetical protein
LFQTTTFTRGAAMVVMWCRTCGALLGVGQPVHDWSSDKSGFCTGCGERILKSQQAGTEDKQATETVDDLPSAYTEGNKAAETTDDLPTDNR